MIQIYISGAIYFDIFIVIKISRVMKNKTKFSVQVLEIWNIWRDIAELARAKPSYQYHISFGDFAQNLDSSLSNCNQSRNHRDTIT